MDVEALRETLDRLRIEVDELRASRKRIVLSEDADRRMIERELHESVQQHLVALAVNLQLAGRLVDADPGAAKTLIEAMSRDVQRALDETAQLAQSVYPPLLEAGGLVAALRSAAASAGVTASVEITPGGSVPPDAARTVYLCCLHVLEQAAAGSQATVTVRHESGGVAFEVIQKDAAPSRADGADAEAVFERLRDRVEALGGGLTIDLLPGGGSRVAGSLPLSR